MKYFAFISYNQHDTTWGKRVQRKLEHYRMPATLCREHEWSSNKPLKPIFFAPTDIQPGGLSDELQHRLANSENLIVICSPRSARSEWVGREIAFFQSLGRGNKIHLFIVDGVPHSGDPETECFNPVIEQLGLGDILGANVHEKIYKLPWLNRERAYIQLITKLLGVEFDTLWNRHKRLLRRKIAMWTVGIVLLLTLFAITIIRNKPQDVTVRLDDTTPAATEHAPSLTDLPPLKDAVISISLKNEEKSLTITSAEGTALFANIPAKMIGRETRVRFECRNYVPIDTILVLSKELTLPVRRDPEVYGHLRFTLYNSSCEPVPGVKVEIEGVSSVSDEDGVVEMRIPVERQRVTYRVSCDRPLRDTLLDAPCGNSEAIFLK